MEKFPKIEVSVLVLGKDNSSGGGKRLHTEIRRGLQFLRVAEVDEHGPHAGAFAAVDVAPAIADHPRAGEVEPEGGGGIEHTAAGFRIGAAVSGAELAEHAEFGRQWPGVLEGFNLIGSTQIQGRASLGGNLCNASPAADGVPGPIRTETPLSTGSFSVSLKANQRPSCPAPRSCSARFHGAFSR